MTQTMGCSEARMSLGVYVLGALEPAERAMVDSHLAMCRYCRDELGELAGLPTLLARVSTAEAVALAMSEVRPAWEEESQAPPERLVGAVLDLAAARRLRRRWREAALGLVAAVVIAAGVFGGLAMTDTQVVNTSVAGPAGPWQNATGQTGSMVATVDYRQVGWGTQVATQVSGIPTGTLCEIWVVGSGNSRLLVGSWIVDADESGVWYQSPAAISAAQIQKFVITVGKAGSITADS